MLRRENGRLMILATSHTDAALQSLSFVSGKLRAAPTEFWPRRAAEQPARGAARSQPDEQRVREQATLLAPATPNVRAAALQVINTLAVGFTS